ncbi:histidine kinase [Candidatus Magnetoovum chiemensis]|nr:histidine kinase [Candidatus Magnetoovum chiemensis]
MAADAGLNSEENNSSAGVIEIGQNTYWAGSRTRHSTFQFNPYVRQFKPSEGQTVNLVIDPGPAADFLNISRNIISKTGSLRNIHVIIINNAGADAAMGAVYIEKASSNIVILTSMENSRLLYHFDLKASSFKTIDQIKNYRLKIMTGHVLRFIMTPYCADLGAFATYDIETRVLYTGKLFSGIKENETGGERGIFAAKLDWNGIKTYHQMYMPSEDAMKHALDEISQLDPKPLVIAPQYGNIIKGELIQVFMDRLYHLPVGFETLMHSGKHQNAQLCISAANALINNVSAIIGEDAAIKKLHSNGNADKQLFNLEGRVIKDFYIEPLQCFEYIYKALITGEPEETSSLIKLAVAKVCTSYNLHLRLN